MLTRARIAALLLLLPVAWVHAFQAGGAAAPPPSYPQLILARDAIWGHLTEGNFREPSGLYYDRQAKELFVADTKNALIGIFDPECTPVFAFGGKNLLEDPRAVAVDPQGSIYVLESPRKVSAFNYRGEPQGEVTFPYPAHEGRPAGVASPTTFTIDARGTWYVADSDPAQVLIYNHELELQHIIRPGPDDLSFGVITDIGVSDDGKIAVLDYEKTPVQLFDAKGRFLLGFGRRDASRGGFTAPVAVDFDEEGRLFIVDMLRHEVKIFLPNGTYLQSFGGWFANGRAGRAPGEMLYPVDIVIVPEGPIFVAERFGNRVQLFRRFAKDDPAKDGPVLSAPAEEAEKKEAPPVEGNGDGGEDESSGAE